MDVSKSTGLVLLAGIIGYLLGGGIHAPNALRSIGSVSARPARCPRTYMQTPGTAFRCRDAKIWTITASRFLMR